MFTAYSGASKWPKNAITFFEFSKKMYKADQSDETPESLLSRTEAVSTNKCFAPQTSAPRSVKMDLSDLFVFASSFSLLLTYLLIYFRASASISSFSSSLQSSALAREQRSAGHCCRHERFCPRFQSAFYYDRIL